MENLIIFLVWIVIGVVFAVLRKKPKSNDASSQEKNIPDFKGGIDDLGEILEEKIRSFREEFEDDDVDTTPSYSQQTRAFQKNDTMSRSSNTTASANALKYNELIELTEPNSMVSSQSSTATSKPSISTDSKGHMKVESKADKSENEMQDIAVSDIKNMMLTKPQTAFLLSEIFKRPYQ